MDRNKMQKKEKNSIIISYNFIINLLIFKKSNKNCNKYV